MAMSCLCVRLFNGLFVRSAASGGRERTQLCCATRTTDAPPPRKIYSGGSLLVRRPINTPYSPRQ